MNYRIESGIKAPKEKPSKAKARLTKIFNEYCSAYESVHVVRPDDAFTLVNGLIHYSIRGVKQTAVSDTRMKELTRMLKDRRKDM